MTDIGEQLIDVEIKDEDYDDEEDAAVVPDSVFNQNQDSANK